MTIKSIQKVIKVGSSLAVTIPAKDARFYKIRAGDYVEVSITFPEPAKRRKVKIIAQTKKLVKRPKITLRKLIQL